MGSSGGVTGAVPKALFEDLMQDWVKMLRLALRVRYKVPTPPGGPESAGTDLT